MAFSQYSTARKVNNDPPEEDPTGGSSSFSNWKTLVEGTASRKRHLGRVKTGAVRIDFTQIDHLTGTSSAISIEWFPVANFLALSHKIHGFLNPVFKIDGSLIHFSNSMGS